MQEKKAEEELFENQGQKFLIRPMKTDSDGQDSDVTAVLSLWAAVGLHEGTGTIQSFGSVDPKGFLVTLFIPEDGSAHQVVGCVAGVEVDPAVGHFCGLYAVRPDFQGRGIGVKMWRRLMDGHVQSCPSGGNAGLYAVPEHEHTYRDRAGFGIRDPDRNMVVHMSRAGQKVVTDKLVSKMGNVDVFDILSGMKIIPRCTNETTESTNTNPSNELEQRVIKYDESVTGCSTTMNGRRNRLLRACFRESESLPLAAVNKFDQKVVGYICLRTNNVGGCMIGPLYADDDAVAELLLKQAIERFDSEKVTKNGLIFMPFDSNPGSMTMASKLDLNPEDSIPRFFTNFVPKCAKFDKIYCIHTPNFFPF